MIPHTNAAQNFDLGKEGGKAKERKNERLPSGVTMKPVSTKPSEKKEMDALSPASTL